METAVIIFSNEKTAERFEALTGYDQQIEVPPRGKNCNCQVYKGLLRDITPCAAERYVEYGGNLIAAKLSVNNPE